MSVAQPPAEGFGAYLAQAIAAAGYRSRTAFARAAGIEPSVVNRWIRGETEPTAALLERAAPALGIPEGELVAAAFPNLAGRPRPPPQPKPVVDLIGEVLAAAPDDREAILDQVRRVVEWARYRRESRPGD